MPDDSPRSVALERYRILMAYLQYENATYWARANFFLVANSLIFGFVVRALTGPSPILRPPTIVAIGLSGVVGFYLTTLWKDALDGGGYWCDRWERILRELEPAAFEQTHVLRRIENPQERAPTKRARRVAERTVTLFLVVWGASLAYAAVCLTLMLWAR